MRIHALIIGPDREDHIARHHVSVEEVEQIASGLHQAFRARYGYYGLVGQTEAGRYLTLFVGSRGGGVYGPVTARDADERERALYRRYHPER